MSNCKRVSQLSIIGLFAALAVLVVWPSPVTQVFAQLKKAVAQKPNSERAKLAKKPAPSGTLNQRLDKDDGYGLVLFYSADIHGNLEVCGCPIHPLGGVARRMGYINAFRKRSPDAAIVMADVGRIFADDLQPGTNELRADAQLMNDWIVRANEAMNLELINLSYRDLPYAGELLQPGDSTPEKPKPEKSALISANVKVTDATRENPAPYIIKTVTGKRLKLPVRIAFIGLSDLPPDNFKERIAAGGFVIHDPLAAAKKVLAEVHDKADVTVIIGYLKRGTAVKLAQQNDNLDLIINSDGSGVTLDPLEVNNTLIVYAAKETKHLGELRFYTDDEGVVDRFTNRYVELDEVIPDDPQLAKMTKQARREIDATQTRMAEAEAELIAARIAKEGAPKSPFTTSEACAKCHVEEYKVWQKTLHSHAFTGLEKRQRIYDAACVGCHSVGYQQQGFINIKATPQFANVQCESCHGPGAEHAAKPIKGQYPTPAAPASCVVCHDRDNSPDFVFAKYWPVVAHGKLKVAGQDSAPNKGRTKKK
jgi:2',3'-cyclic-nucleotide 2'-phosphodiesterase (5'-nucleotidase family)